mmetsp:Transcript_50322/g.163956  ORF Transcript_50322/g.163956 Transcript_50322/m.163956 type:complete len:437 (+) Transcript_50322:997-2307(+)
MCRLSLVVVRTNVRHCGVSHNPECGESDVFGVSLWGSLENHASHGTWLSLDGTRETVVVPHSPLVPAATVYANARSQITKHISPRAPSRLLALDELGALLLRLSEQLALVCNLFPLRVPIDEEVGVLAHQPRKLYVLLHNVHHPLTERARLHAACLVKFLPRLCHRRLVGGAGHSHPTREPAQLVDGVEGLRAAVHLQHCGGAALRRPHASRVEGEPVDLVLEDAGEGAVHLGRDPHVRLRPERQRAQLLDLWVVLQRRVAHREALRAEDAHVGAHRLEQPRALVGEPPAEGALAQGAVQDKHARRVRQLGTRGTKVARCLEHVAREPVVASARTGQVKARAVSEPAASAVRVGLKRVAAVESVGRLLSRSAAEASAGGNGSCGRHGHSGACRGWGSPHDHRSDGPDEEEERRRGDLSKSARRWFVGELRAARGRG